MSTGVLRGFWLLAGVRHSRLLLPDSCGLFHHRRPGRVKDRAEPPPGAAADTSLQVAGAGPIVGRREQEAARPGILQFLQVRSMVGTSHPGQIPTRSSHSFACPSERSPGRRGRGPRQERAVQARPVRRGPARG